MYDIFISYRRDGGHEMARLLYENLKMKGLNCFFDLEELGSGQFNLKLLNSIDSSKNFVVILSKGSLDRCKNTDDWVRMEIEYAIGKEKNIVPFMMDGFTWPDDLPESLSKLPYYNGVQLVREYFSASVEKLIGLLQLDRPLEAKTSSVDKANVSSEISPLLERAFMFLEDGKWDEADSYCEKVLDKDPKNAEAYLGKLMAELEVSKRGELQNRKIPFDRKDNYQKAMRFGDEKLKSELSGYIEFINERILSTKYSIAIRKMNSSKTEEEFNGAADEFSAIVEYKDSREKMQECLDNAEKARLEDLSNKYSIATSKMNAAKTEEEFKKAAEDFSAIIDYKDSKEKKKECLAKAKNANLESLYNQASIAMKSAKREAEYRKAANMFNKITSYKDSSLLEEQCLEKAEIAAKDAILASAKSKMSKNFLSDCEEALVLFSSVSGFKDADEQSALCQKKIDELKEKDNAKRLEREQQAEIKRKKEKRKARIKRSIIISIPSAVCLTIAFIIVFVTVITPNNKYNDAIALAEDGKYKEAIAAFEALNGHKDSEERAQSIYEENRVQMLKDAEVGDLVYFGSYEQDNDSSNGNEYIEWVVLDKKDNKILVISKYALEHQPYHHSYSNVTWESCSLRKWLNETFFESAFSEEDRDLIATSTVLPDKNPRYSNNIGNETQDKLFLFGIAEVEKYFPSDDERKCDMTEYAKARGGATNGPGYGCSWWLRTHGWDQDWAAGITNEGVINTKGVDVDNYGHGYVVRPAMWINLDA